MTLLSNEVEAIHRAKKATNAIRDDVAYAEVESAIDDLIKVIGRVQARLSEYEHNEHLLDEIQILRESNSYLRKDCEDQKQHIKRLEEAGDAIVKKAERVGIWPMDLQMWHKAKEDSQ